MKDIALAYHKNGKPGKLAIEITKPVADENDLALAYTPGVSHAVQAIADDPSSVYDYTAKGNLVAVITNGSAILGMGNLGPSAAKPVMEGKAILFKKCADIDAIDIEVDASDPETFIDTVARISPTFGGINLEDIKAPDCFIIEDELRKRLDIPVFHDDQHGTAIIVSAAILNGLEVQKKSIKNTKIVFIGAGAAAIATAKHLVNLGFEKDQITMLDRQGVINHKRTGLNRYKQEWARQTEINTLDQAVVGADVVVGLSGPNILTTQHISQLADKPLVFALSNPTPEIMPDLVQSVKHDAIIATGRSDFPNQVNNLLCFPYIFRGALDSQSKTISRDMMTAATKAIMKLAKEPVPTEVINLSKRKNLSFGPNYIIPLALDYRLKHVVSKAVSDCAAVCEE